MTDYKERIEKLKDCVVKGNVVFFGGAGVSTASGIPDFRSKNGLYNTKQVGFEEYNPEYLLSIECLKENPVTFFSFFRQKLDLRNFKPNICHEVLALLEEKGLLNCVITQNIDDLHQLAGSKKVYELHGSAKKCYCVNCGKEYNIEKILDSSSIPRCECGGIIRPDIVLYGEKLPKIFDYEAPRQVSLADTLIVGGTSLNVFPAASVINYFKGNNLIIINNQSTHIDEFAKILFHENIENVFGDLRSIL